MLLRPQMSLSQKISISQSGFSRSESGLAGQTDSQAMANTSPPELWSSVPSLAISLLPLVNAVEMLRIGL